MRHRTLIALILLALAGLLAACNPLSPDPTPTAVQPTSTSAPEATETPESLPTSTAAEAEETPTEVTSGLTPAPSGTGTASAFDAGELQVEVTQIESNTIDIRGLAPREDVPEEFLSQEQLKTNLTAEIKKEYTPEESARDAKTLWLLRLIGDPSLDLLQLQIDLLGEQVLGYYDPEKDELFVRSDPGGLSPNARMTLAHEFVHSLQDQYYDLEKLRPEEIENDRGTAILALVEGDATASGLVFAMQHLSQDDLQALFAESAGASSDVLDQAPRYIRDSLLFPYDQGLDFVTRLGEGGSFSGVDTAFKNPPQSSEQILHPGKYLGQPRDEPVEVSLPPLTDTLGAGWTYGDSDTLGEFDLRIMLEENGLLSPQATATPTWQQTDTQAARAAAGWGGARYVMHQKGDDAVVLTLTRWDTPDDATEFADALTATFDSLRKEGDLWTDGKRFFAAKNAADWVAFASGTDRDAVTKALGALNP